MFEKHCNLIEEAKRIERLEKENLTLREALTDTNNRLFNYWYCDDTGRTPKGTIERLEANKVILNN